VGPRAALAGAGVWLRSAGSGLSLGDAGSGRLWSHLLGAPGGQKRCGFPLPGGE
jgi:hypothetical protein